MCDVCVVFVCVMYGVCVITDVCDVCVMFLHKPRQKCYNSST